MESISGNDTVPCLGASTGGLQYFDAYKVELNFGTAHGFTAGYMETRSKIPKWVTLPRWWRALAWVPLTLPFPLLFEFSLHRTRVGLGAL